MRIVKFLAYWYTQFSYRRSLAKWIKLGCPKDSWYSTSVEFCTFTVKVKK